MASVGKNLMRNVKLSKLIILEKSFNKDKSVCLSEIQDTKKSWNIHFVWSCASIMLLIVIK